jgi:hypothetical protein
MHRLAFVPLAGGVVLLVTWIAAPAAPRPFAETDARAEGQSTATTEVDAQVARLRARLAAPVEFPPPARNPFRFVPRPDPPRPAASSPADEIVPAEPAAPVLPVLLAITTAPGDPPQRTAVLRTGIDDIRLVKVGDRFGDLVIQSIAADGMELVDPVTSRTYRIALQ